MKMYKLLAVLIIFLAEVCHGQTRPTLYLGGQYSIWQNANNQLFPNRVGTDIQLYLPFTKKKKVNYGLHFNAVLQPLANYQSLNPPVAYRPKPGNIFSEVYRNSNHNSFALNNGYIGLGPQINFNMGRLSISTILLGGYNLINSDTINFMQDFKDSFRNLATTRTLLGNTIYQQNKLSIIPKLILTYRLNNAMSWWISSYYNLLGTIRYTETSFTPMANSDPYGRYDYGHILEGKTNINEVSKKINYFGFATGIGFHFGKNDKETTTTNNPNRTFYCGNVALNNLRIECANNEKRIYFDASVNYGIGRDNTNTLHRIRIKDENNQLIGQLTPTLTSNTTHSYSHPITNGYNGYVLVEYCMYTEMSYNELCICVSDSIRTQTDNNCTIDFSDSTYTCRNDSILLTGNLQVNPYESGSRIYVTTGDATMIHAPNLTMFQNSSGPNITLMYKPTSNNPFMEVGLINNCGDTVCKNAFKIPRGCNQGTTCPINIRARNIDIDCVSDNQFVATSYITADSVPDNSYVRVRIDSTMTISRNNFPISDLGIDSFQIQYTSHEESTVINVDIITLNTTGDTQIYCTTELILRNECTNPCTLRLSEIENNCIDEFSANTTISYNINNFPPNSRLIMCIPHITTPVHTVYPITSNQGTFRFNRDLQMNNGDNIGLEAVLISPSNDTLCTYSLKLSDTCTTPCYDCSAYNITASHQVIKVNIPSIMVSGNIFITNGKTISKVFARLKSVLVKGKNITAIPNFEFTQSSKIGGSPFLDLPIIGLSGTRGNFISRNFNPTITTSSIPYQLHIDNVGGYKIVKGEIVWTLFFTDGTMCEQTTGFGPEIYNNTPSIHN